MGALAAAAELGGPSTTPGLCTAGGHGRGSGGLSSTSICPGKHLGSLCPDAGESPNPRNEIKDEGEVAGQ